MAKIAVPYGYNTWEIVRLSGVEPVIVEGPNASFTYVNGELTVSSVTQAALEQGLARYDHDVYMKSIEPTMTVEEQLRTEVAYLKQRDSQMQDDISAIIESLVGGL